MIGKLGTSLQARIPLLAIAVVLVAIWTLVFHGRTVLREDTQRLFAEQQYSLAKLLADQVGRSVSERMRALEEIAGEISHHMEQNPAIVQETLEHQHHLPALFNGGVLATRADGNAIAETLPTVGRVGVNYRGIDSVARALDTGVGSISRPVIGTKLKVPVIGLTVPIRNRAGRIVGALAGVINLSEPNFLDVFARNAYGWNGGYLLLVDSRHRLIVTASDKQRVMEALPAPGVNPGIDRYLDGAEGYSMLTSPAGLEVLAAVKQIPVAHWYVAVLLPTRTAFAPIQKLETHMGLAAVVLSLLAGFAVWLLLRRQLRPLLAAAHSLSSLTLGKADLPKSLPIEKDDEVGRLIGSFNHLLGLLARREGHLKMFQHAVEQNPQSILITDARHRIVYVNPAFCASSGYALDEAIGQTPILLSSGNTPVATFADLRQSLAAQQPWWGEFINRRKDGSEYVDFAVIAPLHQPDGQVSHYVAIQEDITEKKRLGAELDAHRHHLEQLVTERTRELEDARRVAESATEAKSRFIASISHEIRTPLNAIIGMTRLIGQAAVDAQQKDHLDKVNRAAHHLLRIINDVLDLSKIEAGKLTLVPQEFTLEDVFDLVLVLVQERAAGKGLRLSSSIDPALDGRLVGDALRIEQVLVNFLGNAIKFTEHGGIEMHATLVIEDEQGLLMRCEVSDSGIGIAPEALARLFHDYEQAAADTAHKYGGTGLGLSICQRLAKLMGGTIGADSSLGTGSTFWFTVRLARGQPDAAETVGASLDEAAMTTALRRDHADARILLVEDEPINRIVTIEMLKAVWPHIDVAQDGAEAVNLAHDRAFDLILMDMQMPVMDGLEATRRIRQLPNNENVPILAMTADGFAACREECLAVGMCDFLIKPVEPAQLLGRLLKWLALREVPSRQR